MKKASLIYNHRISTVIVFILLLYTIKIYRSNYSDIIWDKKYAVSQNIYEKIDFVDYRIKNIQFKIFIRENDCISNFIRKLHYWSDCAEIYEVFWKYKLWNYSYFIDVGANIGSCSLIMLYKGIHVIAFEPIQNNLHLLTKSVIYNNFTKRITLYMIGLGEKNIMKNIYIYPGNWGASSLFRKTDRSERISIFKLDSLNIYINNKIGMMKIDIECNEEKMIKGAKKFIEENYIKIIYFEQLCFCYRSDYSKIDDIYIQLELQGYEILNKLNCYTGKNSTNVIAIRRE